MEKYFNYNSSLSQQKQKFKLIIFIQRLVLLVNIFNQIKNSLHNLLKDINSISKNF